MVAYDVIMLLVIVLTAFRGFQKGMAWQIASLAAIVVSYLVAVQFRGPVSEMIDAEPPWNRFAAMLLLFLGTSFVIWMLFQAVRGSIDRWKLRDFDRQMGALFGIAKGIVLCSLITLFAVSLLGDGQRQTILGSKSGYYIARFLNRATTIMPEDVRHVLAPYLERLDGENPDGPPYQDSNYPDYQYQTPYPQLGQPPRRPEYRPPTGNSSGDNGQPWQPAPDSQFRR